MCIFQQDFPLSVFVLSESHVIQALWHIMALYGTLWHIMALYGTLWHFTAHYGTLWHIMAQSHVTDDADK
jgi:hypothetical protein